ncbi:MAG: histidinol dehydrogenase [Dehalococcoidales bacterium]|nr:histidinol dehydrogenase [Dehalococcoidales bacterium]
MEIIKGMAAARKRLTRQTQTAYGEVSPAVKNRLKEIFKREISPEQAVAQILEDVRTRGDVALVEYTLIIDKVKLISLEVSKRQIAEAYKKVDSKLVDALKVAAGRIRRFHKEQKDSIWHEVGGREWGQVIRPLNRVGFYVPGGMASYPSTVLATVVPAKVAGVKETIIVTPPQPGGIVPVNTIVAADIAGADRIFNIGGAQAVAALAYGTKTVPRVDKICGPGNVFVMLAKKQVFGTVAIDALQGPSEVLVIADDTANPKYCAADLLAQAEHDTLAQSIFITTSVGIANKVKKELEKQLAVLPRKNITSESMEKNGAIIVVTDVDEAIELANLFAPEHLELMVTDAKKYVSKITNAGCIFVGEYATEPIGDYVAGPSHALPTGGTARFSSPLNILDFLKIIDVVKVNKTGIKKLGNIAMTIARAEGLEAHARAVEKRLEDLK